MRVAHEHQKKSAQRWMGCRETMEIDPDHRQYLKNTKLEEELEDLDENDDEEDNYFEIDERVKASSSSIRLSNLKVIITLTMLCIRRRL
jgi:hypothetical protein